MKKYIVIGNPIEHSLSPQLHNHWIKENNINAVYEKKKLNETDIKKIINEVKNENIHGINVTIPFKKSVLPFLDQLTPKAIMTQSVNTIFKEGDVVVGDNTDIGGFELSLKNINFDPKNKKVFVLGAGGVSPSIIVALKKLGASSIALSNRTKAKAEELKKIHTDLKIVDWGQMVEFDMSPKKNEYPLIHELFLFPFVKSVFLGQNFISIEKNNNLSWDEISFEIRSLIQEKLNAGILVSTNLKENKKPELNSTLNKKFTKEEILIEHVFKTEIRPYVMQDGGDISLISYKNGVVKVLLQGACNGCPSSTFTLKQGIEKKLKEIMGDKIQEVVPVN